MQKLMSVSMLLLATSAMADVTVSNPEKHPNQDVRFIVKFKKESKAFLKSQSVLSKLGLKKVKFKPMAAGLSLMTARKTNTLANSKTLLAKLRENPLVEYAVIDKKSLITPMPIIPSLVSTPSHELQWDHFLAPAGVYLESAPFRHDGAWSYSMGQSQKPVVVAVLDTGLEPNERLLKNLLYDNNHNVIGWNFAGHNNNILDETGSYHGTHVAGTIAADANDNYGMGPKLKLLPVKIPDQSGMFYESAVINGIYWALGEHIPGVPNNPYPAKVMNMSFGIDEGPGKEVDSCDAAVQSAIDFANKKGAVIVVAAGNNNMDDDLGAPAGCKGTIRVSSTGPTGLRAYYSNYGEGVSYAAPGGDKHFTNGGILSTVKPGTGINNSGLAFMQGTSMASPHVAGLFGLVFAYGQPRQLNAKEVKRIVYSTTHAFGDNGNGENDCQSEKNCGHGIINANAALIAVNKNYQYFVNSPAKKRLKLISTSCPRGLVKPTRKVVVGKHGRWLLNHSDCVSKGDLNLPTLTVSNNSITAHYGNASYTLTPVDSNLCEKVGVDGVGCY